MGMFDSIYIDDSASFYFPLENGLYCKPTDEWQTKDLTDSLATIVLTVDENDNVVTMARYKDQMRPWRITASFTMYWYPEYGGDTIYRQLVVVNGKVEAILKSQENLIPPYPFAKEIAEDFHNNLKNWTFQESKK